jgi:hypothetical protein
MTSYRVIASGLFVDVPGLGRDQGFYTSLYIKANDMANMRHRAEIILRKRQRGHNIKQRERGLIKSHYLIAEVYEIIDDSFSFDDETGGGFSFFSISGFDKIRLSAQYLALSLFKPWQFLDAQPDKTRDL